MDQKKDHEEQQRQEEGKGEEEEDEDMDFDISALNMRSKVEKVRMYECWSLNRLPDLFGGAALSVRRVTANTLRKLMQTARTKHPVSDIVDAMAIAHYGYLQDTSRPGTETSSEMGQLEPSTHPRIPTFRVLAMEPPAVDLGVSEGGYSRLGNIPRSTQPSGVWLNAKPEGLDRHEIPNRDTSGIPLLCFVKRNGEEVGAEYHRRQLENASFRKLLMDMPREQEEREEAADRGLPESADVWDQTEYVCSDTDASYFILYVSNKTRRDRISNGKSRMRGEEKQYELGSIYDVTTGDDFETEVWLNSGEGPDFHRISSKNRHLFVFAVRENESSEEQNLRRAKELKEFDVHQMNREARHFRLMANVPKLPPQIRTGRPLSAQ
jgi:hypothetical protein